VGLVPFSRLTVGVQRATTAAVVLAVLLDPGVTARRIGMAFADRARQRVPAGDRRSAVGVGWSSPCSSAA